MKYKTLIATVTLSIGLSTQLIAHAADFDKPVFIKGGNLNQNQLEQTKKELGIKEDQEYEELTIQANEVNEYLGTNLSFITSSATIEKKRFGKGVDVEILTPNTITKVTNEQYMNSAITAGIHDANIKVSSVSQVTGEGALTGIYKAYEENGNTLNSEDIQNANQEMTDISAISEENQSKEGFSDEALNAAIADIKKQLSEIQRKQDGQLTKNQVTDIVNDVLKSRGLNQVITEQQTSTIINNMYNITQSNIFKTDPKAFEQQAKNVKKQIEKSSSHLIDKAKEIDTEEGKNFIQNLLDIVKEIMIKFIDFVKNLFN